MVDACNIIKVLLKNKKLSTDNNIFRLHYKFTVILLLFFSLLVSSKQYFGDPIDCYTNSKDRYAMDTYCWIYSTFTLKLQLNGEEAQNFIYPGVGPSKPILSTSDSEEIISHKYYQWVCIVLFGQAVLFYFPRYLWKIWEAGRLSGLVKDLDSPIIQPAWNQRFKESLIEYMTCNSFTHNIYLFRYTLCEFLNFSNVTAQIFLMDRFLGGHFHGFGLSVFFNSADGNNPMSYIFPKLAKCTFSNFGPSGTVQQYDALCVLPLNIINEKIYLILWIWFYFLALISLIGLFYRIMTYSSKTVRVYLLMAQVRFLNKNAAAVIVDNISSGDWFILTQIGKNVNPIIFHELVKTLGTKVSSGKLGSAEFSRLNF